MKGEIKPGAALEAAAIKHHKYSRSHTWKRQVIKEKCLKDGGYKNAMNRKKPQTMSPPCTSQHCLKMKNC